MSDYNEYLNITVLQENKPVTYKSLARALGIHVNKAKQALYEFSESQSNVRAVYCITGTSLKTSQFTIQLVKEAELDEAKKGYKEISGIHVYSITSFDPDDFSIFYAACKDAPQLAIEDRVKCGILKNSNVVLRDISPTNRTVDGEKKSAPISNTKSLTSNASTKPTTTSSSNINSTSKPTKPSPAATTTSGKRKGTLNFGPPSTKKQVVTASSKNQEPVSKPVAKKSINKMKPKNEQDVRMAKTSIKASDIFSDDEEEDQEEEEEEEKDQMEEPQPAEDLDIEIEDVDMDVEETVKEEKSVPEEPLASTLPGKVRKKVLKKRTTKNSRGHLVTEEYWDWEEVDEAQVRPTTPITPFKSKAPSTAAQQNTKKSASKNAKKPVGQSNLLNFFKKA
ncbi:hypothetical protein HMPREF1544_11498 [Mucor circinelloides 1006PhL]|uniref:DNA polymerase delta subunit 3 n=1 Tax=Mucor circinelloides f. circinelloides (strain 1006PhL) TaxID=1220926 RepID=S2IWX1_MUCC1|nr:hypothetical protein HMPREF1544_11498 [Mucor circinelloides 1006PhL]